MKYKWKITYMDQTKQQKRILFCFSSNSSLPKSASLKKCSSNTENCSCNTSIFSNKKRYHSSRSHGDLPPTNRPAESWHLPRLRSNPLHWWRVASHWRPPQKCLCLGRCGFQRPPTLWKGWSFPLLITSMGCRYIDLCIYQKNIY